MRALDDCELSIPIEFNILRLILSSITLHSGQSLLTKRCATTNDKAEEIYDEDLIALVGDRTLTYNEHIKFVSLSVNAGSL